MKKLLEAFTFFIPDKLYLSIIYFLIFRKKLNLKSPTTYNEKLQWLKLNDRNPLYTVLVDKYAVKEYMRTLIGDDYILPTIAVYENVDEIDLNKLPNSFVLKTTHDSGGVIICKNKNTFDIESASKFLDSRLKRNFYYSWREWPYKNVKPRIIAEKYIDDLDGVDDYKFFCFNGKVKYLFIATERQSEKEETKFDFYDRNFNHLPFTNGHPNSNKVLQKPKTYDKMISLAEKISKGIPHVRVDLYTVNEKIFFGEMTFYHWSGLKPFNPEKWDIIFGDEIDLSSFH